MCPEGTVTALVVLLMFDLPLGPAQLVLSMEVTFVDGTMKVFLVVRCPLFIGAFIRDSIVHVLCILMFYD